MTGRSIFYFSDSKKQPPCGGCFFTFIDSDLSLGSFYGTGAEASAADMHCLRRAIIDDADLAHVGFLLRQSTTRDLGTSNADFPTKGDTFVADITFCHFYTSIFE